MTDDSVYIKQDVLISDKPQTNLSVTLVLLSCLYFLMSQLVMLSEITCNKLLVKMKSTRYPIKA